MQLSLQCLVIICVTKESMLVEVAGNNFYLLCKINLQVLNAIDFFRCLEIELKREKIVQIFKLVQLSIITLMMFGLSLVSTRI